jgi:hypothetical protein
VKPESILYGLCSGLLAREILSLIEEATLPSHLLALQLCILLAYLASMFFRSLGCGGRRRSASRVEGVA